MRSSQASLRSSYRGLGFLNVRRACNGGFLRYHYVHSCPAPGHFTYNRTLFFYAYYSFCASRTTYLSCCLSLDYDNYHLCSLSSSRCCCSCRCCPPRCCSLSHSVSLVLQGNLVCGLNPLHEPCVPSAHSNSGPSQSWSQRLVRIEHMRIERPRGHAFQKRLGGRSTPRPASVRSCPLRLGNRLRGWPCSARSVHKECWERRAQAEIGNPPRLRSRKMHIASASVVMLNEQFNECTGGDLAAATARPYPRQSMKIEP